IKHAPAQDLRLRISGDKSPRAWNVYVPVPVRRTCWGLSLALSVIVTAPLRGPVAVGLNLTLMEQPPPGFIELAQLSVCVKSAGLAPVIAMLPIDNVPVPVFVSCTLLVPPFLPTLRFPKESDVGDRLTAGAVPVPVRLTVCGLPAALSVTLTAALLAPVVVGVNVTLTVQLPLGATAEAQRGTAMVRLKAPDMARLGVIRLAVRSVVMVTLWVA